MSAPKLSLTDLRKLNPCTDRLNAMADIMPRIGRITASQAREKGASFEDILWAASAVSGSEPHTERAFRMWMADCAAHVLPIYEASETSTKPREAIIAARKFANGEIDAAARDAAAYAARDAAGDAAAYAAWAAADAAAGAAAWDAALDAALDAERAAKRAAAWAAAWEWQFNRLCEWLSDDQPEPLLLSPLEAAS